MLSKSQARAFFLGGTAVCALTFIGLTIDTFRKIPAQTRAEKLSPEVARGKHLFEKNNCMGCHTILGEGAYYAPELTKVFERRGAGFIDQILIDPAKMYPGERKMVKYNFTAEQRNDLIEFFKWIGQIDLNGFPPKPDLDRVAAPDSSVSEMGKNPKVFNQMCLACHSLNGKGGAVGPALDGVGDRLDAETIANRLKDPQSVQADSKMPKLPLSEEDIKELVAFLSNLKGGR